MDRKAVGSFKSWQPTKLHGVIKQRNIIIMMQMVQCRQTLVLSNYKHVVLKGKVKIK